MTNDPMESYIDQFIRAHKAKNTRELTCDQLVDLVDLALSGRGCFSASDIRAVLVNLGHC